MRVRHEIQSTAFDDPNIVSCAGLVPVVALAERAGLHKLIREHLHLPGVAGSNPVTKVVALMAGMVAGADNINKMDLLRHGAMGKLFSALRAPPLYDCGVIDRRRRDAGCRSDRGRRTLVPMS